VLVLAVVVLRLKKDAILMAVEKHQQPIQDGVQRLTAVFVTMQIILLVKANHETLGGSELPSPYAPFLQFVSFLALDAVQFVPFNCIYDDGFDHFDNLLLETLAPIAIFVLAHVLVAFYRIRMRNASQGTNYHTLYSYAIAMLFLVLPTISRRIGQSLQQCDEYDGGQSTYRYLSADHTIACDSSKYTMLQIYAAVMLLVYPFGVPLMLLSMLRELGDQLNPPNQIEADVIVEREESKLFDREPIASFSRGLRPRFYLYECYNMLRRLSLTVLVLGCESLAQSTIFVVFVSIVTLVIERESSPYLNRFLSAFTYGESDDVCCRRPRHTLAPLPPLPPLPLR
jgi:hypothetical protein